MRFVYAKFPPVGLGNCLLIWGRAKVFSEEHDLPLVVSNWSRFRAGSWIRNENKKRIYHRYFKCSNFFIRLRAAFYLLYCHVIREPVTATVSDGNTVYVFTQYAPTSDLFAGIRSHRKKLTDTIFTELLHERFQHLSFQPNNSIGVHVRRGDFKNGSPITPLSFFIDCIENIRECLGFSIPVEIYTDGDDSEITRLLLLPDISKAKPAADVVQLLQLSRHPFLILSKDSSFSYWAAFLSDAIVLMNSTDWQQKIIGSPNEIRWTIGDNACKEILRDRIAALPSRLNG